MKDILIYKEYIGSVHFNADDEIFYGRIEGIDDLISFEGSSVKELKKAFEDSVEDYLELCKKAGKKSRSHIKEASMLESLQKFIKERNK